MKNLKVLLAITLLAFTVSGTFAQKKKKQSANSNEIELVKSVIDRESKAFFSIDPKTWSECWIHAPYAYWSFADTTDVNFFEGWEAINNGFAAYFKTSKPSTAKMERHWHEVRVYGNSAYARFTQKVMDDVGRDEQAEVRVLEKENGLWKIVHLGVIAKQKGR